MKYNGAWLAGLEGEEKERFAQYLAGNNKVLDKLSEICYNMIRNTEIDSSDYNNPNWALSQADKIGYRRALKSIIKLCTISE